MIRSRIRQGLNLVLGKETVKEMMRIIRRQPLRFSEADLILAWFDANPRTGVMIDVGAHFGESLEPYLSKGWKIHAFEPDPSNRDRLRDNIDHRKISLYEIAVSDREETDVPFFASSESDGISSLSAFRETHQEVNRVRLSTLATIMGESKETRVDFLKIDAEGHDFFVLRGFPWERIRPDVILCEFEDRKTIPLGYRFEEMAEYLGDKGYQVFVSEWSPIARYGVEHRWVSWTQFPCRLKDTNGWGNLVAFKDGVSLSAATKYLRRFGT